MPNPSHERDTGMDLWLKRLFIILDKDLDERTKIGIMESCGEECPFTHLTDERLLDIMRESEDESDFLEKLSRQWRVRIEDGNVYVVFDRCYCPLAGGDIGGFSETLCYCTQGNLKKKFRLGLGREVNILMERTILAGDKECRFRVVL